MSLSQELKWIDEQIAKLQEERREILEAINAEPSEEEREV